MEDEQQMFLRLGVALAIGLVIGVERGWKVREARGRANASQVCAPTVSSGSWAGAWRWLPSISVHYPWPWPSWPWPGCWTTAYAITVERDDDAGITSLVAGLLAFVFGALAALGQVAAATAYAVVTTLLLGFKPVLHRWVSALEGKELRAALKLLLISVVLLPILPDRGYGRAGPESLPDLVDGGIDRGDLLRRLFRHQARGRPQGRGDRELVRRSSLVHGLDPALLADGTPRT